MRRKYPQLRNPHFSKYWSLQLLVHCTMYIVLFSLWRSVRHWSSPCFFSIAWNKRSTWCSLAASDADWFRRFICRSFDYDWIRLIWLIRFPIDWFQSYQIKGKMCDVNFSKSVRRFIIYFLFWITVQYCKLGRILVVEQVYCLETTKIARYVNPDTTKTQYCTILL